MKVRPILMNGDMVRAVLEGRKTQTRRVVRLPDKDGSGDDRFVFRDSAAKTRFVDCPYGQTGDLLWVRETFQYSDWPEWEDRTMFYRADRHGQSELDERGLKWKPSIHMPRWASRLTLEITDVRVERLQEISEEDAIAEGIDGPMCQQFLKTSPSRHDLRPAAVHGFAGLWGQINGDLSWRANPWVWVIEFKAHRMNVDEFLNAKAA